MSRARLLAAALPLLIAGGCGNTQVVAVHGALLLTPMIVDFHTVCLNSTSEFDTTLENDGDGTLTIQSTAFSNPAFTLLADLPGTVTPRGTVVIRIGFTPTIAQSYSAFFTIKTDAPAPKGTQQVALLGTGFNGQNRDFEVSCLCDDVSNALTCGLTGSGHMTVQPCDFLSFDNVVGGTTLQRTVTVQNLGCEPLTFTQAILSDANPSDTAAQTSLYLTWFSFDPTQAAAPPQTIRGGQSQDYVVQFSPPVAAEQTPVIQLQLVSDDTTTTQPGQTTAGTWTLGLLANSVAPSMLVTPNILTFFGATMGVPDTQPFTIQNNGEDTLQIDSIKLSGSGEFSVTQPASPDIAANSQIGVNVSFTATSGGGATGTVTVSAAGGTQTVALVGGSEPDLTVTWLAPGNATPQAPPVNWGTTQIGDTNDPRTVQLTNTGTADLLVSKVITRDITNSQASTSFSVTTPALPLTIPAGQSSNVTVVFNDDITLRDDSGKLVIYSNNPADAPNGGYETVDLLTTNDAVYKPIPDISVSAEPNTCKALTLNASQSTDPQGSPLTYQWALTLVPHGSKATLSSTSGVTTTIVSPSCQGPDLPGSYVVTLTVGDQYPQNTNTITQAISVQ